MSNARQLYLTLNSMQLLENKATHRTHQLPSNRLKLNRSNLILPAPRSALINQTSATVKTKGNKKTASVAERRELDIT